MLSKLPKHKRMDIKILMFTLPRRRIPSAAAPSTCLGIKHSIFIRATRAVLGHARQHTKISRCAVKTLLKRHFYPRRLFSGKIIHSQTQEELMKAKISITQKSAHRNMINCGAGMGTWEKVANISGCFKLFF